jgi:molybdate transport system substrate-binding protein
VWLGVAASATAVLAQPKNVVVFAAASLKNAMDEVSRAWERETGKTATIVYAASNLLAKQIEAGAPADIFVSADLDWMDYAASKKLIRSQGRVNLLGNTLVLIAPKNAPISIASTTSLNLSSALGQERLAMANVDAVPAGKYGRAALEKLGQWESVKSKIVQAESVRAALLLVSRGEAPLGIVYGSDAASDSNVKIVAVFPAESHPPILYPASLTADSRHADAAAYMGFLRSPQAKAMFEEQGFTVLNQPDPRA